MDHKGLTSSEADNLLKEKGYNEIPQKEGTLFKKLLKYILSPITLMLLTASLLSLATHKIFDFYFILFLLLLNIVISFWQESKADNAIKKLNEHLSAKSTVMRDGKWKEIDSRELVEGDLIKLSVGDLVPSDGKILSESNLTVNESALTGESLPKEKKENETLYSGSFIATGLAQMKVTATGKNTYFGKTLFSVERTRKKSILEKDIVRISKFLSILSIISVVVLTIAFLLKKAPILELMALDLSLVVAGIPISLPTVMTLIIELGVLNLAKKKIIVRRLSALEDLADVDFLLTDKTGTLTKNKITVTKIITYDKFTEEDAILYAKVPAVQNKDDQINKSIIEKAEDLKINTEDYRLVDFIPADSIRKRSTTIIVKDGQKNRIVIGAAQIIKSLCKMNKETKEQFEKDIVSFADKGYRSLAVAISSDTENKKEENMQIVGLLALSDTVRSDAKDIVTFLKENGIHVSMITGDNVSIAREIAKELEIENEKIISRKELESLGWEEIDKEVILKTGAFAEILPEDKFQLVKIAKKYFVVAANGDGINDLPAIKEANVGIAVANAVSALKAAADIVLLAEGISVIKDAIIESRKIFARIYSYSTYRISESLRLVITIALLGIFYREYPLTTLQIILLVLLNDIPIISLAFDRVKLATRPAKIQVKERFILSSLFGMVGVVNSILMFIFLNNVLHMNWAMIQTIYFLKLTISGHLLIYVARTKKRWFEFLPAKQVILATTITQLVASLMALTGIFMPAKIPLLWIGFVWLWSFFFMQVGELMKDLQNKFLTRFS